MSYLLAVIAAFANAMTTILQRLGVETAPQETTMRLSLMVYALRRRVWLAGFAVMIGAFVLQFAALHFGRLSTVQPILTLELPFLVAILGLWFRHPLGWHEWAGALVATAGLAAFLALADPTGGPHLPDPGEWVAAGAGCAVAVLVAVLLTRVGSGAWKAAMFGIAAAITFAFTASVIREANLDLSSRGWGEMFLHWPPYILAVSGLIGMFLTQNAFHAGPVTASQATLVIVDPLVSILIGVYLFDDRLATSGFHAPGEAVALLALFAGVYSLARSPLVANVKSEDEVDHHMLSNRHRPALGSS
ncbi:MAG: DMT family transporter [Acidimicrobiales bacterium]